MAEMMQMQVLAAIFSPTLEGLEITFLFDTKKYLLINYCY